MTFLETIRKRLFGSHREVKDGLILELNHENERLSKAAETLEAEVRTAGRERAKRTEMTQLLDETLETLDRRAQR